jgi:hypothetical protein
MDSTFEQELHKLWFNAGLRSYHTDRNIPFNEKNRGFGVEYDATRNTKIAAGHFLNSVNHDSKYAGVAFLGRPVDSLDEFRVGAIMGVINGYPEANNGKIFPMLAPMISYEGKNIGVNILGLPKIGDISPVVAAMMKVRF